MWQPGVISALSALDILSSGFQAVVHVFFLKDLRKTVERKLKFMVKQLTFTRDLQCWILCKGKKLENTRILLTKRQLVQGSIFTTPHTRTMFKARSFQPVVCIIPGGPLLPLVKNTGRSRAFTHSIFSLKENLSYQYLYPKWEERGGSWKIFDFCIITITSHSWSKNAMGCSAKMLSTLHPLNQNHLSSFSVKEILNNP